MARPKDDISSVAVDLAAGQDTVLKLMERQKERENTIKQEGTEQKREQQEERAKKRAESEEHTRRREKKESRARDQASRDTAWITPSFKIKASRSREIDQLFFAMRARGEGHRTKQELVEEALSWLVKKYVNG